MPSIYLCQPNASYRVNLSPKLEQKPKVRMKTTKEPRFLPGTTCLSDVPYRIQRGVDGVRNLPLFVFVAGLEGAGHRILDSLWQTLSVHIPIFFIQPEHNFHNMDLSMDPTYRYPKISAEDHLRSIRQIIYTPFESNAIIVDHLSSFPLGNNTGSLNQPDFLHILQFDGILYDLRVIMLYRDPYEAVQSAVREAVLHEQVHQAEQALASKRATADVNSKNKRSSPVHPDLGMGFKTLEYQARVTEETLAYLNNAMMYVPCEQQMWLEFECLEHNAHQYIHKLADFLHIPTEYLSALPKNLSFDEALPQHSFGKDDLDILRTFLTDHADLWPHMSLRPSCSKGDN